MLKVFVFLSVSMMEGVDNSRDNGIEWEINNYSRTFNGDT